MGTQVGNATPIEVAAAESDERDAKTGSDTGSFSESGWSEEGTSDF